MARRLLYSEHAHRTKGLGTRGRLADVPAPRCARHRDQRRTALAQPDVDRSQPAPKQPERLGAPSQSTIKPLPARRLSGARSASGPRPGRERRRRPCARRTSQFEGGASFDPHALPLPPELAPPVYDWLRRLALQADLPGADKLLREAFADLTSSLSVLIIYSGPEGLHTLGANDEMPTTKSRSSRSLARAARSSRTHIAYVPIATTTETIAVVQLTRNSRQQRVQHGRHGHDGRGSHARAREHHASPRRRSISSAARVRRPTRSRSIAPEALESHRRRGQEGS